LQLRFGTVLAQILLLIGSTTLAVFREILVAPSSDIGADRFTKQTLLRNKHFDLTFLCIKPSC
jgi:hypothetical protein